MHPEALMEMDSLLKVHKHVLPGFLDGSVCHILDVGSYDVNGTHRPIIPTGWQYTGSDIRPGPNVDIIQKGPCWIQEVGGQYDVVLCSSVLEHTPYPWCLVNEMVRMLSRRGLLFIGVPWVWEKHDYPGDYWRMSADGVQALISYNNEQSLGPRLSVIRCYEKDKFTWAVAQRTG